MYSEIFQELGLTPNEAKIYDALLEVEEAGVSDIALKADVNRRNVYDAVSRLIEKQLVFQSVAQGDNIYKAVPPSKLLEIIKEKENRLKKVLPDLQKKYENKSRSGEIFIYRGLEGFKNYLRDVLHIGGSVYLLAASNIWFDKKIKNILHGFANEAISRGIAFRVIFLHEAGDSASQISDLPFIKEYKVLPADYSASGQIGFFGDYSVTFSGDVVDDDFAIYTTIDSNVVYGYRSIFDYVWRGLPDVGGNRGVGDGFDSVVV